MKKAKNRELIWAEIDRLSAEHWARFHKEYPQYCFGAINNETDEVILDKLRKSLETGIPAEPPEFEFADHGDDVIY